MLLDFGHSTVDFGPVNSLKSVVAESGVKDAISIQPHASTDQDRFFRTNRFCSFSFSLFFEPYAILS